MELGFNNVELEGDSAVLINSLKDDHRSLAQFGHIVVDIHYLASHFSFFKLFMFIGIVTRWLILWQEEQSPPV